MRAFLEIWGQDSIQHMLSGSLRNDNVFGRIDEELRHWGFHYTIPQCHSKLKSLKKKYKEIVERSKRSHAGNKSDADWYAPADFPYFDAIHAVMSGRGFSDFHCFVRLLFLRRHRHCHLESSRIRPRPFRSQQQTCARQ